MVSQVRVTSVGACQTTYRSTELEGLAGKTRPAGPFLHYYCTIHEIVRQSFGVTEKTCDVVDNDDAHAPRCKQLDDRVLFLQMVVTSMSYQKAKHQTTGESHRYNVPYTLHRTRLAYTPQTVLLVSHLVNFQCRTTSSHLHAVSGV